VADTTAVAPPVVLVERWPTEIPLLILSALAAAALWILAAVTIIPLVYAALLALFFFVGHLVFVGHVRGSAVRVGPDQLPAVHDSVTRIAAAFGLGKPPEAYVMQAGGSLNALATRLFRSNVVVLFSDLLDACGDDAAARDMIVGHELGHIRAGHLRWHWALLPAWFVPFLGAALSRAREYTCDRYGLAAAGDTRGAILGLTILAAGGAHGRRVDTAAFARQRHSLNTGWMVLAEWLASHPPLAKRLVAIAPSLAPEPINLTVGYGRAVGILLLASLPFVAASAVGLAMLPKWLARMTPPGAGPQVAGQHQAPPAHEGIFRTDANLRQMAAVIEGWRRAGEELPWDSDDLHRRWSASREAGPEPLDPFDGNPYAYEQRGTSYRLWGVGPDGEAWTDDDLIYDSRTRTLGARSQRAPGK
jgi:Zn-dependent protease with chaperone function